MIESYYWKEDLLKYSKQFKPVSKPARWSERKHVSFEKEVIISFFMIRKLIESNKFSPIIKQYKATIFRSPCVAKVNNLNYSSIERLYDMEKEEAVSKNINFLCNQLIHGGAMFAYREKDRNWGGMYTCSDFERQKYIYRIPISEIVMILELAGNDYPKAIIIEYDDDDDESKHDYKVTTYAESTDMPTDMLCGKSQTKIFRNVLFTRLFFARKHSKKRFASHMGIKRNS